MTADRSLFATGTWTREPVSSTLDASGALVVEAAEGSDWSTGAVDHWEGSAVTVRASRFDDAVVVRARSTVDPEFRLVRVARFPHESASIGPMLCAPTRAGFRVRFLDWRITPADTELHPA